MQGESPYMNWSRWEGILIPVFFGQLKKQDREIIEQSLEAAGIAHKANNYVSELSDGERQKA